MGSASLSCPSLTALLDAPSVEVIAVVTQPDRPKGRHLQPASCPVKVLVGERGIPVLDPVRVNAPEATTEIASLEPDVIVVVAYGQILKPVLLEMPPLGCINVHASLLPAYRGAAPIQWAIARGESVTGVTTMHMSPGMDEGDIILRTPVPIGPTDTGGSLHDILAAEGAALLMKTLAAVESGRAPREVQDHEAATYAPKLTKAAGRIDWTKPASELYNRIRAFNPWPVCWTELPCAQGRLRVFSARVTDDAGAPGTLLALSDEGPVIAAGAESLCLLEVQGEGGRVMSGAAYCRGHGIKPGQRWEG
jgi:methionyl-tRNA formyltransferase